MQRTRENSYFIQNKQETCDNLFNLFLAVVVVLFSNIQKIMNFNFK